MVWNFASQNVKDTQMKVATETWLTFNRLHGIVFQKIEFFIATAVRTSNLLG
jgi:hypothetical protein